MKRLLTPPVIDGRTAADLTRMLRGRAPHYAREWSAKDDHDPGVGLIRVFSSIAEGVITRLNAAPKRNFIAFLDMLGIRLLHATPARAAVRFVPATGTETTILVPPRTQVSAATPDGELSFETETNLLVVPGTLPAVVAVNPESDAIYEPPPGFLQLTTAARDEAARTIVAFSSIGSNSFQLDLVDELEENDILRLTSSSAASGSGATIGCAPTAPAGTSTAANADEYVVIQKVEGHVVFVKEPLRREYSEGARVQKLTRFTLFEGKNLQEHLLYLGHDELFNVKSAATFEVLIVPRTGTGGGAAPPLQVMWEFWGVPEGSKDDAAWHPLTIEADGSAGLTQAGRIVLTKVPGEIQTREVNAAENRWIRARLAEPILPPMREQLPELEAVTFRTLSAAAGIPADAGFFNETPIDVNLEFRPFGFEPRTFDRFYLGSEEAFSKPGADVTIDISVDVADLISVPAVVTYQERTLAFAHGAGGRLLRFKSDPTAAAPPSPFDYERPPGTRMTAGSAPAASVNGALLGVFIRADDGHVWLARLNGDRREWFNLQAPAGVRALRFDPAAITVGGFWQVFIVADNDVYTRAIDPSNPEASRDWASTTLPATAASSPFVALDPNLNHTWVVVTDLDGLCHRLRVGTGWDVITPPDTTQTPRASFLAAPGARPFAQFYRDDSRDIRFAVFLRSRRNRVVELDIPLLETSPRVGVFQDWGPDTPPVDSNPWALEAAGAAGWRVFIRDADDNLWEGSAPGVWRPHTNLAGARLRRDPIAIAHMEAIGSTRQPFISVFSASNRNSLVEFQQRLLPDDRGALEAGPGELAFFAVGGTGKRAVPGDFVQLVDSIDLQIREVKRYDLDAACAVLTSPWRVMPDQSDDVDLLSPEASGLVQDADESEITLEAGDIVDDASLVLIRRASGGDILREIAGFDATTRVLTVTEPWDVELEPAEDSYVLLLLKRSATITRKADVHAVLSEGSLDQDDLFNGALITFTSPDMPSRQIERYLGDARMVTVSDPFEGGPRAGTTYAIVVSPRWPEHRETTQIELRPQLSWEYWNGSAWSSLQVSDGTQHLLVPGTVEFRTPPDIAATDVAGQENYWVRARIVGGDYGREIFVVEEGELKVRKDPIRPPLVKRLTIAYESSEDQQPERCLTFNNLAYVEQTAANNTPDKHYLPFAALSDAAPAVYFGFDRAFRGGPIRLLVAAQEMAVDENRPPRLTWEFRTETGWRTVPVDDQSQAYTREELITLQLPDVLPPRNELGRPLHWLRSTLREGRWPVSPVLAGVFPNSVWTIQAETILNEILGSSDASADQPFSFQRKPVLPGEEVRVREVLTGDEREQVIRAGGEDALLEITDQQGRVLETWTRWTPVDEFFEAAAESRVYRLDRASAEITFGDGIHGRVPPAGGDNIVAFAYQSGGGTAGNVAAGTIATLVTAVAGIDSVINPVPAGAGSEEATVDQMLEIGPAQISHRARAVTPQDFESLALEASREVRKTRCVPNRNARGQRQTGRVSVFIVPDSTDAIPMPSLELRRSVRRQLEGACDVSVASRSGIFVGPPLYVPVDVAVTVFVRSIDDTAVAELNATHALSGFLHPLTGGADGRGWDFGQDLPASQLYTLLEKVAEIDHVEDLVLGTTRGEFRDRVEIGDDELVASGEHQIRMAVVTGG